MRSDELDVRARLRAHVRKIRAELVVLGVPRPNIDACRTVRELHDLRERAYRELMKAPDPSTDQRPLAA